MISTQRSPKQQMARLAALSLCAIAAAACGTESRIPTSAVPGGTAANSEAEYTYDGVIGQTGPLTFPDSASSSLRARPNRKGMEFDVPLANLVPSGGVSVIPGFFLGVGNCIPFGQNRSYSFQGFVYRNIPAFTMSIGDKISFDLGSLNDVDVRRNIWFAKTNINPGPYAFVSQGVAAVAWVKVVSESQIPLNPKGNFVVGDYELTYTAEAPFTFAGGGFAIGFSGNPPATYFDGGCEQVLVVTQYNDPSGLFYQRFYGRSEGDLSNLDGGNNDGFALGGFKLTSGAPPNQPPTISLTAPSNANEGSAVSVTANVADPNNDVVKIEWDFDNDGIFDFTDAGVATPGSRTRSWTYPDNMTATVKAKVTDAAGASANASMQITIDNVAPTVGAISAPAMASVGQSVSVSANFTDPGTLDTHTATINWGDGTTVGTVAEASGSGSVSGSHAYSAAGIYTVAITVTDKDGGVGLSVHQYVIVTDPSAGFVTGGGWIMAGGGKSNYGLNAKYQGTTLSCNTMFKVPGGGMFQATSCDWLVVSGTSATYAGTGTIDGSGSYSFFVSVIDGGEPAKGGVDRFRIRIEGVWDTQPGPITDAPSTPTGGGNIQVHTKS